MSCKCRQASDVCKNGVKDDLKDYKTKQRDLILSVFSTADYFTADEIYEKLLPDVNRSTVYRNLEKLTESGKITRKLSKDGSRAIYRLNPIAHCEGHLHLICSHCGGVIHLSETDSDKLEKVLKKSYGFSVNDNTTVISGICESCLKL